MSLLLLLHLLLSPSSMLVHIPHPRYIEEHLQFPLLQCTLINLTADKFYLVQKTDMLIREVTVLHDIRP